MGAGSDLLLCLRELRLGHMRESYITPPSNICLCGYPCSTLQCGLLAHVALQQPRPRLVWTASKQ